MKCCFLFLVVLLVSCQTIKPTQLPSAEDHHDRSKLEALATEQFGMNYATKDNKKNDYVIVFQRSKKIEDLISDVQFFIFDKKAGVKLYQDKLEAGTVDWYSDYEVVAISRIKNGSDGTRTIHQYYYDVQKQEKIAAQD